MSQPDSKTKTQYGIGAQKDTDRKARADGGSKIFRDGLHAGRARKKDSTVKAPVERKKSNAFKAVEKEFALAALEYGCIDFVLVQLYNESDSEPSARI